MCPYTWLNKAKNDWADFPFQMTRTFTFLPVLGVPWIQCVGVHIVLLLVYWALFYHPPQSQRVTVALQTQPADKRLLCVFMYQKAHLTRGTLKNIQNKKGLAPSEMWLSTNNDTRTSTTTSPYDSNVSVWSQYQCQSINIQFVFLFVFVYRYSVYLVWFVMPC